MKAKLVKENLNESIFNKKVYSINENQLENESLLLYITNYIKHIINNEPEKISIVSPYGAAGEFDIVFQKGKNDYKLYVAEDTLFLNDIKIDGSNKIKSMIKQLHSIIYNEYKNHETNKNYKKLLAIKKDFEDFN